MDTLKILLGATVALLLAALGLSWKNLQPGGGDPAEAARQRQELAKLREDQARLQEEVARLRGPAGSSMASVTPPAAAVQAPPAVPAFPETTPEAPPMSDAEMQAKIAELEKERQAAEKLAEQATRKAGVADEEARLALNRSAQNDRESRRIAMIQNSMVMAKVETWTESAEAGSFATIRIHSMDNVQPGTELYIRRNGGLLGKLRVDTIEGDEAIANPVTRFPEGKGPVEGDELILEPPFPGQIGE